MKKKLWIFLLALALCVGALCAGSRVDAATPDGGYVDEGDDSCDQNCIAHVTVPGLNPGQVYRWHVQSLEWILDQMRSNWNAKSNPTVKVKFLRNAEMTKTLTFSACITHVIFDLNGKTISGDLDSAPVVEVNYGYGPAYEHCITFRNGTIENTAAGGTALKLSNGAAMLENVNVTGDLVLGNQFAKDPNYIPTFLGGGMFTKIRGAEDDPKGPWTKPLESMLGNGCYMLGSDGKRLTASQYFGTSDNSDIKTLENVQCLACDHKDADSKYTLFEDATTKYGALAMRCTECGNLCPHDDDMITDGPNPTCTACGLSIFIKTTNLASGKPVGPYYYTGLDDAMYEILHVNKGAHPTLELLRDTESICQVDWLTNDYDGITIDLAGHTLTLIGNKNNTRFWVTFLNSSNTPGTVLGAVNVHNTTSDRVKLVVLNEYNNLTIETVNIGENGTAVLAGGGFGTITISENSLAKTLADLLTPGYCYYVGGDYKTRTGGTATLGEGLKTLTNVYVAPCDHSGTAAIYHSIPHPVIPDQEYYAWTCPCGKVIFAARSVDAQGTVMYYSAADFAKAFKHAASGTTVALLPLENGFPTGSITIDKNLTIDVGEVGSYANELHFDIAAGAHVAMIGGPADTQCQAAQFYPAITVQSGGTLTVPANHAAGRENRIIFNTSITVEQGGTAEFYGCTVRAPQINGGSVTVNGGELTNETTLNSGTLTVSGSSTTVERLTVNGGTVTVTGGKLKNPATLNGGELIVNGGEIASTTVNTGGQLTVTGGMLTGELNVTGGTVDLSNANLKSTTYVIAGTFTFGSGSIIEERELHVCGGEAIIDGGTIFDKGSCKVIVERGKLTLNSGEIGCVTKIENGAQAELNGGNFGEVVVDGQLTIDGAEYKRIQDNQTPPVSLESRIYVNPNGVAELKGGKYDCVHVYENATLIVRGGSCNLLDVATYCWDNVTLSGGTFGEIQLQNYEVQEDHTNKVVVDITYSHFASMLADGKAYQKLGGTTFAGDNDVKDSEYTTSTYRMLENVTVTAAPFTGLTVTGDERVTYGSSAALTVKMDTELTGVTYKWYLDGKLIDGATGPTYRTADTLSADTYTFVCEASYNGYVTSASHTVTVQPRLIYPIVDTNLDKPYDGTAIAHVEITWFSFDIYGTTNDIPASAISYEITNPQYEKDNSGTPTADVGTAIWVGYTLTLHETNYALGQDNMTGAFFRTWTNHVPVDPKTAITQNNIGEKTITSKTRLTILNKHQKTYQITLKDYLPKLTVANCEFGDVTYSGLSISLMGYYTDRPPMEAKLENGILTLPILNNDTEQTAAGRIQLTISSTNYKDFILIIKVDASNKTLPTGTVTPSRTTLTYGEKLSDITLSGEMKDGDTVVAGTFQWDLPDEVLEVGEHDVRWTFLPDEDETYLEVAGTVTITVNPITYSVSVAGAEHGTVTSNRRSAAQGQTVTITVTPEEGYVLDTLTVTDAKGNEIALTVKDGGRYTFKMPGRRVTVTAAFKAATAGFPFTDVKEGSFYYDAVHWAWEEGITDGWGRADTFAPGQDCTRAQIVTFLWRAAGCPVVNYFMPFTDVDEGAWYAEAVRWAASEGITAGYGRSDIFAPDQPCTRAQAVTFLFRALEGEAGESSFSDVPAGAFYADAVGWAWENGITEGIGGGKFGPGLTCQRAQIVTLLYRALVK